MNDVLLAEAWAPFLHQAQLANAVTAFVTCMAGILPVWFTLILGGQPRRWHFVYWCIVITAIPTVWFHAYEQNAVAQAVDTGSNIVLTWAMLIAVTGDFSRERNRAILVTLSTVINLLVFAYMTWETISGEKRPLISFGDTGFFWASEVALIANSLVVAFLFCLHHRRVPQLAKPLLYTVLFLFVIGAYLSTAKGDYVTFRIVAWHATWHILSGCGLITLWLFNYVRFGEARGVSSDARA